MDELAIGNAIVGAAAEHAGDRSVLRVHLRIGALRQVSSDTLAFYFAFCARGTACEGAVLEQESIALRLLCGFCAHQWEPDIPSFRCPRCATPGPRVIAGEELVLESIEVGAKRPGAKASRAPSGSERRV